MMLFCL